MPLARLSGDEQRIVFSHLCDVLDPGSAVALSSVSNELRTATQAPLPQLKADHEAAAALCLKLGHQSCKELREAKKVAIHSPRSAVPGGTRAAWGVGGQGPTGVARTSVQLWWLRWAQEEP